MFKWTDKAMVSWQYYLKKKYFNLIRRVGKGWLLNVVLNIDTENGNNFQAKIFTQTNEKDTQQLNKKNVGY